MSILYIDTEIVKKSKISSIDCDMELQGSNFVCQIARLVPRVERVFKFSVSI